MKELTIKEKILRALEEPRSNKTICSFSGPLYSLAMLEESMKICKEGLNLK